MTATTAMTSNAATMHASSDCVPTLGTGDQEVVIREACGVPTTKLCTHCLEYNFSRETLDPDHRPGGLDANAVFTTFGKLVKSSTICPLCKLILEGLERHFSEDNQNSSKHRVGNDSKVFVSVWLEDETTISFFIIPPEVKKPRHPIPRLTESNLRVYQDIGDWARSPPLIPWSEPCVNRLKQWLSMCLQHHRPECCTLRSGEEIDEFLPPILPSRVIDVGPLSNSVDARLMESNGRRGYYTALSYCWGSSQKADRPYLTTTKTLEKHLSELPWDLLPKTLQDSILLTRAIGVQYPWIDSLCIIQDSNADWKKEAARMGTVYAQARLVIAATTGADAEAGLFPFQTYIHRPSETSPPLYFSKLPKERGSPQRTLPLFTRGWTTQEWVLARRIVFWTQDRMCWYCAKKCAGDDGKDMSTSSGLFERYTTWSEVVTRYSGRGLTYPTDKLIAISGIANEIQKKKPEDKYVFGSWQSEIHWELLWSGQAAQSTDSGLEGLNIPSWSWACHPGGVQFLRHERTWQSLGVTAQSFVSFLEDSSLQIVARTKTVNLDEPDMVNYCFRWFRHDTGSVNYEWSLLPRGLIEPEPFAILSQDVGHCSVQIAFRQKKICMVFDSRDFLSTYQKERDILKYGKRRKAIRALQRSLGMSAGVPDEFSFVEIAQNGSFKRAGLLLRKSPHTPGTYIRVGLGFAFESWWKDAKRVEFVVE